MRRWIIAAAMAAAITASGFAAPRTFYQAVAVTSTSQNFSFGFFVHHLLLVNDGMNEAFFTVTATTATTNDIELKAGESMAISVRDSPMTNVALVASAAETTTVRVVGVCDDTGVPCGES